MWNTWGDIVNEATNFIATLGFPIAIASGLCYVMYRVFMIIFSKFIDTLDKLTETNRILAEGINKRVDNIDNKVDKILENIKK